MITYELLKYLSITDGNVADINLLLPQLTATPKLLTTSAIQAIALHSRMLTARDESMSIKGMGILSIIHKPTGTEGFINDVVVDAAFCGRGIATALMMRLIALAREYDAEKIELTSNPNRTAAKSDRRDQGSRPLHHLSRRSLLEYHASAFADRNKTSATARQGPHHRRAEHYDKTRRNGRLLRGRFHPRNRIKDGKAM